ncbi:MAG: hypothetical protein JWM78_38 [Verrucomicrobiaceae bacterium]|nr:hypothetical protein [Verrucomicrobiaceae bacterium]
MNNKNVSNGPVDVSKLEKWLSQHFADQGQLSLISVNVPANGYSAATILIEADITRNNETQRRDLVLRLEKQGQHVFLDTDIARQGRMMIELRRRGLPAPNVLAIETDATVLGGKFLLMDRIDGVSLPQNPSYQVAGLLTQLDAEQRSQVWGEAISTIAIINRLNWQQGFEFLDKQQFGEPGLDQYLRWLSAWRDEVMEGQPNPIIDAALTILQRDKPDNRHVDVLWGDSNPGNYLFTTNGHVAAVLDFEASALGPAEIDLGWWFFVDGMLSFGVERLPGLPERDEVIARFETELGRKISELAYYELLAALRMALVIARTSSLLIKSGHLPNTNKTPCNNPATQLLAMKLNLSGGESGEDYLAFCAAMKHD